MNFEIYHNFASNHTKHIFIYFSEKKWFSFINLIHFLLYHIQLSTIINSRKNFFIYELTYMNFKNPQKMVRKYKLTI